MLEKQVVVGSLTILELRQIQLREDTVILEDGKELSRTYHRTTYEPGDVVTTPHQIVHDVIDAIWTEEVIEMWDAIRIKRIEDLNAQFPPAPPTQ